LLDITHLAMAEISRRAGLSPGAVLKTVKHGGITIHQADRLAVLLGYHPSTIWGDQFYQGIAEEAA
jgi:lambda repressor-like predicted transcriptional regulator